MVRGDHVMLEKWIAHHSKLVASRKALHIFLHGDDAGLRDIAKDCSVVVLPFDPTGAEFEKNRDELFFGLVGALRGYYRHVITLDCDEFLVIDPALDQALAEYLDTHPFSGAALSPAGFEVVQHRSLEPDPVDFSHPILGQRRFGILDGVYSKPCIFRKRPEGGYRHSLTGENWEIDPNLFLFHLRFFDIEYSSKINQNRIALFGEFHQHGPSHAVGTWADRDRRFGVALEFVDTLDCPELSPSLLEEFRKSQIDNYISQGGTLKWYDSRRGPFRIPARFEGSI